MLGCADRRPDACRYPLRGLRAARYRTEHRFARQAGKDRQRRFAAVACAIAGLRRYLRQMRQQRVVLFYGLAKTKTRVDADTRSRDSRL